MRPVATLLAFALATFIASADIPAQNKAKQVEEDGLTLKKLFPKKGLFGPAASRMTFAHDETRAAYLYKNYAERRHGNDLWIFNVKSGKSTRITSASVMAKFQKSSRNVIEDRKDQAAKKDEGKKEGTKKKHRKSKQRDWGTWVSDDDAEAEKAPRYDGIQSITWSPNKNELLFLSAGDIYRYETKSKEITRLTRTKERESAVNFLPDGSGYTYMRNAALFRVSFGSHLQEQIDPEFGKGERLRGYEISPDGKRIAFLTHKGNRGQSESRKVKIARYTERFMEVREVSRHVSDDPLPLQENSIYLYESSGAMEENGALYKVFRRKVGGPRDILLTPEWSADSSRVAFAAYEQEGRQVAIYQAIFPDKDNTKDQEKAGKDEPKDGKATQSENDSHIKDRPAKMVYRFLHYGGPTTPRMIAPRYLADSRRMVFLSEQSGFRHLHVLDPVYESLQQLTSGRFEVYATELSKDKKSIYALSTKELSGRQDIYSIDLDSGEMTRLSRQVGFYDAPTVSPSGRHVLATFVAYGHLRELVHIDTKNRRQKDMTKSHPQKAYDLTKPKPKFITYKNRHGQEINATVFKPKGASKRDKRPLLIYVYGGPLGTRKQVTQGNFHGDAYFFAYYMAEKHGYVTCTIDPRGVSGYGALFEKANYEQVGKPQVEDLSDGVKYMIANYGIDPERVGIHGWSFGGFQTQMCMYTAPDIFKVGIAGAGPTEWENYNSWYSTGTIGPSREGKTDLKKFSLLPLAKNLEGKLLLVHGMEDANVLYQDTVRVYRELLAADKETLVELFLDPTGGHGLGGDIKRVNKARKYEEFLLRTLGDHQRLDLTMSNKSSKSKRVPAKPKIN